MCTRPEVYNSDELFGLLSREVKNRINSVFPDVGLSETLAMLLQRNFQFERILEQLSTMSKDKLHQMYSIGPEYVTKMQHCLICEEI